jgi:isoprenylcysteine carboxyl methyltransferase (ICMT) family protein YpbQ
MVPPEILRLAIIATLGQFFTVEVTIKQNHKLKKDGFYKYLRHPSLRLPYAHLLVLANS